MHETRRNNINAKRVHKRYKKGDGSALLIIGNLGRNRKQGSIKIDSTIFKSGKHQISSWPDNQKIEPDGSSINIDIDGLGYKMVALSDLN